MVKLNLLLGAAGVASAACPYMTGELDSSSSAGNPHIKRADDDSNSVEATEKFFSKYYLNDEDTFMTSDVGGPIEDQESLSVGERGPTLLEDFIFRQKIQRFDHERV